MKIKLECECGNEIDLNIANGKYCQLRDNLESKSFRIGDTEYNNGKLKEFKIYCDKCNCKHYVSLGVD